MKKKEHRLFKYDRRKIDWLSNGHKKLEGYVTLILPSVGILLIVDRKNYLMQPKRLFFILRVYLSYQNKKSSPSLISNGESNSKLNTAHRKSFKINDRTMTKIQSETQTKARSRINTRK